MAQQGESSWRRELEHAHAAIQVAIEVIEQGAEEAGDLRPAASGIETALGKLYDALDGRAEPLESVLAAQTAFAAVADSIQSALSEEGALTAAVNAAREAAARIDRVADELARESAQEQSTWRQSNREHRIVASLEMPRLHSVPRASLVPKLRVAPPLPAPPPEVLVAVPAATSFDELESAAERIRAAVQQQMDQVMVMGARDDAAHAAETPPMPIASRVRWARELFDEVAMLSIHRAPLMGDDWRAMAHVEQRLLNALDAFAALGEPALRELENLTLDAPVREPARIFALTLITGCLQGRDALGLAERVARDGTVDPSAMVAFCRALKLAPHPQRMALVEQLLRDDQPAFRAVAAELAIHAAALDGDGLARLLSDRPEVAAHALVPMAARKHPDVEAAIAHALESKHAALRHAGWEALALVSRARLTELLEAALDDARAQLMWGVFGTNAGPLIAHVARAPSLAGAEALGYCGTPEAGMALVSLLMRDDEALRLVAARALERITAAGLIDQVDIAPEQTIPRELPEPRLEGMDLPTNTPLDGDPRFAPSEGSPDRIEHPSVDPERWRAWWREHGGKLAAKQRYRHGVEHDKRAVLAELDGAFATPAERYLLQLELASLTQTWVPLDVDDWVAIQERAMQAWRAHVG